MKKSTKNRLTEKQIAVLPCCHDTKMGDLGGLGGWVDGPLAIDVTRAAQLRAKGYAVITRTIPEEITPKNRLLMAHPKLIKRAGPTH
jgi:hypothetical protein